MVVVSYPGECCRGTIRVGDLGQSRARKKRYDRECSEDGHLSKRDGGGTRGRSNHPASDTSCNYKENITLGRFLPS